MKTKTNIHGGGVHRNHNQTLMRDAGLTLKTSVKAGQKVREA